jgi:hypothetical protein
MEHHSLDVLRHRAEVKSVAAIFRRREKIERWAQVIQAVSFFELSEREAHRLFCSCMHGDTVTSEGLTSELRRLAVQDRSGGLLSKIAAGFRQLRRH